jgi:hypothetical protein
MLSRPGCHRRPPTRFEFIAAPLPIDTVRIPGGYPTSAYSSRTSLSQFRTSAYENPGLPPFHTVEAFVEPSKPVFRKNSLVSLRVRIGGFKG